VSTQGLGAAGTVLAPPAPPALTGAAALSVLGESEMLLCGPLSAVPEPPEPAALAALLAPILGTLPLAPPLVVGLLPEKGATVAEGVESSLPQAPTQTNAASAATVGHQMRRR